MNSEDLIYASEVEEFFWTEDDIAVQEGTPIGFEKDNGANIDLILFDDIYWKDTYEADF
tara:strand:+ start:1358 stop:1534 length:177 start_codon:yes stop_codon:yes gene_type:complete